jgi:hypothetical protein
VAYSVLLIITKFKVLRIGLRRVCPHATPPQIFTTPALKPHTPLHSVENLSSPWVVKVNGFEFITLEMAILSDSSPLLWAICIYFFIVGAWTIYSVYLGPLASFPGPKLAAATRWYECYYDLVLGGQYTFKIKELHQKYGMSDLSFSLRDI